MRVLVTIYHESGHPPTCGALVNFLVSVSDLYSVLSRLSTPAGPEEKVTYLSFPLACHVFQCLRGSGLVLKTTHVQKALTILI